VADADAWLSTISSDIVKENWRPPEPSRESVGAYAKRWLALGVGRNGDPLSPTTKQLYNLLWTRWLEPTFGDVALGDVSLETVRTWLAKTRANHPTSTQPAKAYRLLRTILNVAVEDDKIAVNPCRIRGAGRESAPDAPSPCPIRSSPSPIPWAVPHPRDLGCLVFTRVRGTGAARSWGVAPNARGCRARPR